MSTIISDFAPIMPYLDGKSFDEDFKVEYDARGQVVYRADILRRMCTNKSVLHVGCTDHIPLIATKISKDDWLHRIITICSKYTLGVDIDATAVTEAIKISGFNNMISGDITAPEKMEKITESQFDYALFGEVVEHISNPVEFLRKFRENYGAHFDRIIITVPNAFRAGNLRGIASNFERINTDHRFFFTPYTIAKIATDAGFKPESVTMATFTRAGRFKTWILNKKPLLAEDIILVASHKRCA